ncbi:cobyric acid synthase [Prochlorococcus sp. MIT 1223]|uniref:cobyric acid synthase n=1 Tax=Prochlorococcus sp. MIT 1223 TaxID=3096217 RepID=UPI002A753A15|nr:cobyric acid synthase [Prochlorococcus sp. MIT 1223]
MILGTSSGAGKSLMTAAICRVLLRRGQEPVPFKGQNMSNNAWVDKNGGEMAYSQVVQAWASGIEPLSSMNPVLLKPKGNETSEVIHLGKSVGIAKAEKYYEDWFDLGWAAIKNGLKQLKDLNKNARFVLEGAGSPVEVNLQHRDLTNLRLAKLIKADCLLVADIERGGVFAQIIGTLSLLTPSERSLIKGIIINRFRGNLSLFNSGKKWLEINTGIPVLGIMPWLNEVFPPEDSLDLLERKNSKQFAEIEIAVLKLPSISNFSDLDPLESEESVNLKWLNLSQEIGAPDVLIIPGSKQTLKDLEHIKKSGMDKKIKEFTESNGSIFGICGGLQMLGRSLKDPMKIEGLNEESQSEVEGLNLLPIKTVFSNKKNLLQRKIKSLWPVKSEIEGFEIHHGNSSLIKNSDIECGNIFEDKKIGWFLNKKAGGSIAGTYIHGIFDNGIWRRAWINRLRKDKGLNDLITIKENYIVKRELIIDRLADQFEKHINTEILF